MSKSYIKRGLTNVSLKETFVKFLLVILIKIKIYLFYSCREFFSREGLTEINKAVDLEREYLKSIKEKGYQE